jgi:Pup amidohydrolase
MTVHRVMGIETEYGVSVPGQPHVNAMMMSTAVVTAHQGTSVGDRGLAVRWDYEEESPLRDARGFDMSRAEADPSQLTDEEFGLANLILTNGARLYVDHAHPEYSSPEVTSPRDAVLWDRAGQEIMMEAARIASARGPFPIRLYKNNTDNKGASYGCHENYLMNRATPFADIVSILTPFFVTRQIYTGSGRVGLGQDARIPGFQLSQRADFFEVEVGLETTLKRPIINTRDEPHADPERYRRLHVIVGDANMSEWATFLKMGATSLVLALIENQAISEDLRLADPVAEMHAVSHDPTLCHRVTLADGRTMTAIEVQRRYLDAAVAMVSNRKGESPDGQTQQVLHTWEEILNTLATDPMKLSNRLDWVAKFRLLEGYRNRDSLDWDSAQLALVDLQYSDIDPERGLALRLEKSGRMSVMCDPAEIAHAVAFPPDDTRAYFRGECLRRYGSEVAAASWDSIIFDVAGFEALQRVPTLEPVRGTRAHVEHILDASSTASDLLAALRGP